MMFKPNTTYREFEAFFLSGLENNAVPELRDRLKEFVELFPRHYSALLFLAKAEEQLGNIHQAESAYKKVLSLLDPSRVGLWVNRLKRDIGIFASKNGLVDLQLLLNVFVTKLEGVQKPEDHIAQPTDLPATQRVESKPETKSLDLATSLIKEGNRLFTGGRHRDALEKLIRAEALIPEPIPQLFISMGNAALGIKDFETGNRIAVESAQKGLKCKSLTMTDIFALCTIQSSVYKRQEQWGELDRTFRMMLENSQTKQRKVLSILGLIQANSKQGNIQSAREWTDELLIVDPTNKVARRIQAQLSTFEVERSTEVDVLEDLGEEFAVEIAQTLRFSISPMLQVDIEDNSYTDAEILKKSGKPSLDDAERLLRFADRNLDKAVKDGRPFFVFYPMYLEAAKAFSDLESGVTKEESFQRGLSRYASLRAGAFYSELKGRILGDPSTAESSKIVSKLRDSAASYFLESLRLKLDQDPSVAGRIVDDYMKLHLIYKTYKRGVKIDNSFFTQSFKATAEKSLRQLDTTVEYCDALLSIGATNPENFNIIFSPRKARLLNKQPVRVVHENKQALLEGMSQLVSIQLADQSTTQKLKTVFDARRKQIELINVILNRIAGFEFNPRDIQQLGEEWQALRIGYQLFYDTDKQFYSDLTEIIDQFKPYLERSDAERLGIVTFLIGRISELLGELREHPTYWARIAFEPLLRSWRGSLTRLIQRKTQAIQPRILAECDPPSLLLAEGVVTLSLIIRNVGAASVDILTVRITVTPSEDKQKILFQSSEVLIGGIPSGDFRRWQVKFPESQLQQTTASVFEAVVIFSTTFRDQELRFEAAFTLGTETSFKISRNDIPWNETGQVPKELFKGRERLLEKLERHYLSGDRIETYVLFGLTRHGKSSIHKFLSDRLLLKIVKTNSGDKRYLPFSWSFAKAADQTNAKDMWSYLIKDSIYDRLDDYIDDNIIPTSLRANTILARYWDRDKLDYRNTHFSKVLQALNDEGYLPFISIDEFTFYTQMVETGMVKPSFLQQIREITLDEQSACFIFAGIYDLVDILKEPKYGITSQLANTIQEQIGPIEPAPARELIQVAYEKLRFTEEAVQYIMFASSNIPHFIQMICRRCGWYAVETQRNILGLPEVDLIVSTLAGEQRDELPGGVKPLEGLFRDTQYRPAELYNNAVLSTIALRSVDRRTPRPLSREEMIQIWGAHRTSRERRAGVLGNFLPRLTNAIETLTQRRVLVEDRSEGIPTYRIGVDLFRRWWAIQYPILESELDKLIGADESREIGHA